MKPLAIIKISVFINELVPLQHTVEAPSKKKDPSNPQTISTPMKRSSVAKLSHRPLGLHNIHWCITICKRTAKSSHGNGRSELIYSAQPRKEGKRAADIFSLGGKKGCKDFFVEGGEKIMDEGALLARSPLAACARGSGYYIKLCPRLWMNTTSLPERISHN